MTETRKMVSFHLPRDLIIEILLRLPTISLLRFNSVCKTWYALIQNPNFIEKHHQFKSTFNSVLVTTTNRIYINDGGCYKPIDFGSKFSGEFVNYLLLGVSNGLICISFYGQRYIIIGNPVTREFREIPGFRLSNTKMEHREFYGFSSFSSDYKLVRLIYSSVVRAEVYSMSTDSWENIGVKMAEKVETWPGDAFFSPATFMPVVLNGVFHWMASLWNIARIISLDIYKGLFYETKIPISVIDAIKDPWRILEFDEELSLIIPKDYNKFELWVPNEDRSTWSLKMRIDDILSVAVPNEYWASGHDVMGYAKNGELLVEEGCEEDMKMLSYDLHSRETKILPIFDYHDDNYYYFYNESLRSVKLRNEVAEDGQHLLKAGKSYVED